MTRETREGWPLRLTVETEKGVGVHPPILTRLGGFFNHDIRKWQLPFCVYSVVGSLGLSVRYKRFLFCPGCSSRPRKKYFFPHHTLFPFLCPHRQASLQAAALGRLSLSMCLWTWRRITGPDPLRSWRVFSTKGIFSLNPLSEIMVFFLWCVKKRRIEAEIQEVQYRSSHH
jgi:hypothetical protein